MQNVHAMRAEVRADYEAALESVQGDDAFAVRFERFFTELRDPLRTLYGDDERFAGAWERLLRAIATTAAERPRELRMLDHEREVTPDWLQREHAVGYVTYVDQFAGTLSGVRERLPYLRELGVTYLHLMPLLALEPVGRDLALVIEHPQLAWTLRRGGRDRLQQPVPRAREPRVLAVEDNQGIT